MNLVRESMLYVLSTTKVVNSRFFKRQNTVWRRRQTPEGVVFTTRETIDLEGLIVIKKAKPKEAFKPGKLFTSLSRSCDHMEDPQDVAWQLMQTVTERLTSKLDASLSVSSVTVAEISLEVLKNYDTTSYVKYASYRPELVSARKLAAKL